MTSTPRKNSGSVRSFRLEEIAALVGGTVLGDPGTAITGVSGIKEAVPGDITFLSSPKYLPYLSQTAASAVITSKDVTADAKPLVLTDNPSAAFTKVVQAFSEPVEPPQPGTHPTAVVHPTARLGQGVSIGPHAVIEAGAEIGERTVIGAGVYVGRQGRIGKDCRIDAHVCVRERCSIGDRVILHCGAVIGADGFGYERIGEAYVKIPQLGDVRIDDDVEIGANACVDRGRFQSTWIKSGAKIDNLVQIAHNVVIGEHAIIVAQVGISGSTELGKSVIIAGQAGLVGHITVGDGAIIGARSGVSKSVPDGAVVLGEPARPIAETKRIVALTARLPEIAKDVTELKKKLEPPA
ncbi:MAG: UDP-3-O-acylglucosamine N-acyltransferase [Candidatus Omnitrophica bacterium]|nr:UDP-3-O-acylglucosamine N-acyltransferase [Candidatus Omnitrophota bacterium]